MTVPPVSDRDIAHAAYMAGHRDGYYEALADIVADPAWYEQLRAEKKRTA